MLPVRSAPPETRPGTSGTMALRVDFRAALVAMFGLPAFQVGSFCSKPGMRLAAPLGVPTSRPGSLPAGRLSLEALGPGVPLGAPAGAGGRYMASTSSGTQKFSSGGRPRISLVALISSGVERVAVGLGAVGHVAATANRCGSGAAGNWGGLPRPWPGARRLECLGVVGYLAEVLGMPAVSVEALDGVVVEGDLGGAVDGDVVVVVDVNEPPEPEVPGQGSGLVADAFHQVAVAADHEGVMVDEVWPVLGAEDPFGDAHPYAVGEALARAGRSSPRRLSARSTRGGPGCVNRAGGTG